MPQETPITIWIDFSSPYGYIAAMRHEEWAARHALSVQFRPFMLGLLFRNLGKHPILDMPQKASYLFMDVPRIAQFHNIPFVFSTPYPFGSVAACRVFYALPPADQTPYLMGVYRHAFERGIAVDSPEIAIEVLSQVCPHLDAAAYAEEITTERSKKALFAVGSDVEAAGVCGSPYFVVTHPGGATSAYWGQDRMEDIPRAIARHNGGLDSDSQTMTV